MTAISNKVVIRSFVGRHEMKAWQTGMTLPDSGHQPLKELYVSEATRARGGKRVMGE